MPHENFSVNITNVLAEVASSVVGHLDMQELLDQIINVTMKALHAEVCSIFLEDKEKEPGIIKCVAGSGFAEKIVGIATYAIGEGFTGTVAKTGQSFNIHSEKELKERARGAWRGQYDDIQWPSKASEFRNLLALPLKIKGQTLGVIKVENKIPKFGDSFTDYDLKLFEIVANVIALAIENARLLQQTKEQAKTISAVLTEVSNEFVGHFDMSNLYNKIVETMMNTLHAEDCSIFLEDKKNDPGVIKCVVGTGFSKNLINIASYKIGEGVTGMVAQSGNEFNIRGPEDWKNLEQKGFWTKSFDHVQWPNGQREFRNLLALPLKVKGKVIGVIKVENKIPEFGNCFTNEDLTIFKTISNIVAPTIENTRIYSEKTIARTIEFPAEHLQAGTTILNYFGTILKQKYPKEKIKVKIEQNGSKVCMVIETPSGKIKDKVEGTLEKYGLVVQGELLPEEFLANDIDVLRLQNQITNVMAMYKTEKRINDLLEKTSQKRISNLEDQVSWLKEHVGSVLTYSMKNTENSYQALIESIKKLQYQGKDDIYSELNDITQAILQSKQYNKKTKSDLFRQLQYISNEALKPEEHRDKKTIKKKLKILGGFINLGGSAASILSFFK